MNKGSKLKKTLGNYQSPWILSLMRLIETQSKATLIQWAADYAREHVLPVYESTYPEDFRPREALQNALGWLHGTVRYADAKQTNYDAHAAATQAQAHPAAQAAARAAAHAALTIHVPIHCLGLAFYGTAALAYAKAGVLAEQEVYEEIAAQECAKMEAALRGMADMHEPNPAKMDWKFWGFMQ